MSRPTRGVWIETNKYDLTDAVILVTPHAGRVD